MRKARSGLVSIPIAIMSVLTFAAPAFANQAPPAAGNYRCFTVSGMPTTPPHRDDPNQRPLEHGERWVPPIPTMKLAIEPAFFGDIRMDGKGGYRLTRRGTSGRYAFNPAASKLTFTGDLSIMSARQYDSRSYSFFLVWQATTFECGLRGAAASNARPNVPNAPPKLPPTPRYAPLTGRFEGQYRCQGNPEIMTLLLDASPDGKVSGSFSFLGTTSSGAYNLTGTWDGNRVSLTPGQITRGSGFLMVGLTGRIEGNRLTGQIDHPSCGSFEATHK